MLLIGLIDRLIPQAENPHEIHKLMDKPEERDKSKLMRTGLFTALAIAIHNFPEGLATFFVNDFRCNCNKNLTKVFRFGIFADSWSVRSIALSGFMPAYCLWNDFALTVPLPCER